MPIPTDDAVIKIENVHKKFKVFFDKGQSFKERLLFKNRNHYEDRWVLRGVSLEVKKGEAIGLIGVNGCGKSTLLKMMTKIMYPDNGSIEIKGRISSLIELGAGFHPDMSGKENIYTNASIFGLTKKEIDERINDIINFSELWDYMDNPVRTYSSGMYMRLAFAVAINVDADVLLIDEILAVGDASFQAKCFNRLREIKAKGTTIVIVSHSLGQIEQICERSYWISGGLIKLEGNPRDVHPVYLDYMGNMDNERSHSETDKEEKPSEEAEQPEPAENPNRLGSYEAQITEFYITSDGEAAQSIACGSEMSIVIKFIAKKKISDIIAGVGITRNDGTHCYGTNTLIDRSGDIEADGEAAVICKFDKMLLLPGEYSVDLALHRQDGFNYDYYRQALKFRVYSNIADIGVARLEHEWKI